MLALALGLLGIGGVLVWLAATGRIDSLKRTDWAAVGTNFFRKSAPTPPTNSALTVPKDRTLITAPTNALTSRDIVPLTNTVVNEKSAGRIIEEKERSGGGAQTRSVRNILEAQVALARVGISSGCIDGGFGSQTRRALAAYQADEKISITGELDAETKAHLLIEEPVFLNYIVTATDLKRLQPLSATWLGKSEQTALDYETILELVAEKGRAHIEFVRSLNPGLNWTNVAAGASIKIPRIELPPFREKAAFVRIYLANKTLQAFGRTTNLLAHYPCSIAQKVEKRPIGRLYVMKIAEGPNYFFNPEVFPESEEARTLGRKLVLPPGPNNPVGTAWIGLDKPGYGIHGTPKPEQIGRTESHGCFRLANWNAEHLLQIAWVGMPVIIEP